MKGIALNEAVAMIPDGSTMIGVSWVWAPRRRVRDELVRQGKRDLTVIANDTAMPEVGIGKFIGDHGEVAAVAIGAAALGAMGGYGVGTETAETTSTTTVYTTPPPAGYTSLPCTPNVVPANGVTYYQCGSTWYTQAYGGSGVSYMVVAPPPGH